MKKSLLFVLSCTLISCTLFSQSEYKAGWQKGSIIAGGSLGARFGSGSVTQTDEFGSTKIEGKVNTFLFSPRIGTFLADGLAAGVSMDMISITVKEKPANNSITGTLLTAGPFVRYYLANGMFFHGDIAFGGVYVKDNFNGQTNKNKVSITKWQTGIGYSYFLNDHVCIEPAMIYRGTGASQSDSFGSIEGNLSEFSLQVGLSIFLHK